MKNTVTLLFAANGNMTMDGNNGIYSIAYNVLNLPKKVTFAEPGVYNDYVYSASGAKLSVFHKKASSEVRTDYVGNMIYKNNVLDMILVDGGYIKGGQYHFYLQDHLGSNRVVARADGTVVQTNHYYPYGTPFAESFAPDVQDRKYIGKEYDTDNGLNWYDVEARMMDGLRFTAMDPLAEKYYSVRPYAYCKGNPMKYIDPDGLEGIVVSGSPGDHKNKDHFLVNGLDRARLVQSRTEKGEVTTWLIYNDKKNGFDKKTLDKYTDIAKKAGIAVKVVNNTEDIIDYVNNKTGNNSRDGDKVSNFYYIGHATPGDLDVGYQGTGQSFDATDLRGSAFKDNTFINLVGGCRTAVDDTFLGIPVENSVVTQFSKVLSPRSTIQGSNVRVFYSGGVVRDANLLKKNNGKVITAKGLKK
ncbi:MAG: hypothetical protein LBN29_03335 [Mediterranea sp.]|nr:hypothetical protein [Mediterranea sp.]